MHPFMYLAMHTRHHFLFADSCQHDCMLICSHWAKGSLGQAYIEKNPLAALQPFAIASGWEQSSFMRRHFLGRALVRGIARQ